MDILRDSNQLLGRFVVAREQDHTADQRVREAFPIVVAELGAGDIEHYRTERNMACSAHFFSRTTQAQARLFSSLMVTWCPVMPSSAMKCARFGWNSNPGLPRLSWTTQMHCSVIG